MIADAPSTVRTSAPESPTDSHSSWDTRVKGQIEWAKVHSAPLLRAAEERYDVRLAVRILFLAMARANRINHAPFKKGEIRRILQVVDGNTGEIRPATASGISKAIASAAREGMILPSSHARCLRLASWYEKAAVREGSCAVCEVGMERTPRGYGTLSKADEA